MYLRLLSGSVRSVSVVAIATVVALGVGGVSASATPAAKSEPAVLVEAPAPIVGEDTPLNDAWEPPKSANGPSAGESNAPADDVGVASGGEDPAGSARGGH